MNIRTGPECFFCFCIRVRYFIAFVCIGKFTCFVLCFFLIPFAFLAVFCLPHNLLLTLFCVHFLYPFSPCISIGVYFNQFLLHFRLVVSYQPTLPHSSHAPNASEPAFFYIFFYLLSKQGLLVLISLLFYSQFTPIIYKILLYWELGFL